MNEKKPFFVLCTYLRKQKGLTAIEMGADLGAEENTINKWKGRGIPSTIKPSRVTELYFNDDSSKRAFIAYLKDIDYYDLSSIDLPFDQNRASEIFDQFLVKFLAGDIKEKVDVTAFETPVNYFSQTLYTYNKITSSDEVIFDFMSCDFEKIKEKGHILISGPGGQGKSLFLKKISKEAKKHSAFKHTFYIDLPELLFLPQEKLDHFKKTEVPRILAYIFAMTEDLADVVSCLSNNEKNTSDKVLFLLDGLNELLESPSKFEEFQEVLSELTYINENWSTSSTIVITTRPSIAKNWFSEAYYIQCSISGTPKDELNRFFADNSEIDSYIKSLAEIPLYYNSLVKINNKSDIKTKYDLLFNMFIDKYKHAKKQSIETFIAFFVFSPLFFQYLTGQNKHSNIRKSDVLAFSREIKNMSLDSFIMCAKEECNAYFHIAEPDFEKVTAVFLSDVVDLHASINGEEIYKLHDEFRDFLQAFYYVILLKVSRASLDGDFAYLQDLEVKISLNDNGCSLLKQKLCLSSGADLHKLTEFSELNNCQLTPQALIHAHSCFYYADNLGFGQTATTPAHKMLIGFTQRVCRVIDQGNFENCLKDNNASISQEQRIRCTNAFLDVVTKHCEHYRLNGEESSGIKLTRCIEKIDKNYNPVLHQKAKLLLTIFEKHIKDEKDLDLTSLGLTDYDQLYHEALCLLKKASDERFEFACILLAFLKSNPPMYMLENTDIELDYIGAFNLYRSVLFDDTKNFVFKRVSYTIRNLLGLILKGYVRFKRGFDYEEGDPGLDAVIVGDMNTLTLDANTLKFAEYILKKYTVGVYEVTSLNYYRAIIEYHKGNLSEAQRYLKMEKEKFLTSAFNHYVFNEPINLDALCNELRAEMLNPKNNSVESCHPLYWYVDFKKLVLSFTKSKVAFFTQLEETLPENMRKIINQITR